MKDVPMCPIRGHEHHVVLHRTLTQRGTGNEAALWECPLGVYRWFQLKERQGEPLRADMKMTRPRWGWRD